MADEVRGDSRIEVQDVTGTIRTIIAEEDYERGGYKAKGWTVVKDDWTKRRRIKRELDLGREMALDSLAGK